MKKNSSSKKEQKKSLKESLSELLQRKKIAEEKENVKFIEPKNEMKKASNSFKSIMEVHNILVDVYKKLLSKSEEKN